MNSDRRKDCPMRHENGNCLPTGGFCTAVNEPICEALHNAFAHGESEESERLVLSMVEANRKYQERQLEILRSLHEKVTGELVPVVRCKDCRWWKNINAVNGCGLCKHSVFTLEDDTIDPLTEPNDFCSYGERSEGE